MYRKIALLISAFLIFVLLCACTKNSSIEQKGSAAYKTEATEINTSTPSADNNNSSQENETEIPLASDNSGNADSINTTYASITSAPTAEATPENMATASPSPSAAPTPTPIPLLKWEEFYALSSLEKDAYKDSFQSMDDFYEWLVEAQANFVEEYPEIEIGPGGEIDLSKLQ